MAKSRSHRKSILKSIKNTGKKAMPVVGEGLKTVGTTAKYVAVKSAPVVEKGVSKVYGTLASGFDLGVKGVNTLAKGARKMTKHRRYKKHGGKSRRY
jgi:hypothetical protein